MPRLNPDHLSAVIELINQAPYFKHMSMAVRELGQGYSVVELFTQKEHDNPFGGIHGGVYSAAIDTATYWAVYSEVDENTGFTTIDLKIDFLSPIKSGKLITTGRAIKVGRTMGLTEATIVDESGKICGHGTSKMLIIHGRQTIKDAIRYIGGAELPLKFI